MPRPIPTTQLYAFSAPAVKGSDLIVPVTTGAGHLHGLRAPASLWRDFAKRILAATEPEALMRQRITETKCGSAHNYVEAADAGQPLTKPSGKLL